MALLDSLEGRDRYKDGTYSGRGANICDVRVVSSLSMCYFLFAVWADNVMLDSIEVALVLNALHLSIWHLLVVC